MIREANIYDIPRINELGQTLNANFTKTYQLNEMLKDKISKIIVYEKDDYILGFLIATVLYDTCDILSIVVDENNRQKHIGSNLIEYLITDLGEENTLITLEVATKNIPALKLYQNFGFEIINVRKKYYKDDDAYLMARKVDENERY